jgi:hypothetical protein
LNEVSLPSPYLASLAVRISLQIPEALSGFGIVVIEEQRLCLNTIPVGRIRGGACYPVGCAQVPSPGVLRVSDSRGQLSLRWHPQPLLVIEETGAAGFGRHCKRPPPKAGSELSPLLRCRALDLGGSSSLSPFWRGRAGPPGRTRSHASTLGRSASMRLTALAGSHSITTSIFRASSEQFCSHRR